MVFRQVFYTRSFAFIILCAVQITWSNQTGLLHSIPAFIILCANVDDIKICIDFAYF